MFTIVDLWIHQSKNQSLNSWLAVNWDVNCGDNCAIDLSLSLSVSLSICPQGVVATETCRGGQLLEEPKILPFRGNTFSLQVSIQDVPQFLWNIKPFTTCQVTETVTTYRLSTE